MADTQRNTSRRVVIEGVRVRTLVFNPGNARPKAGAFYIGDPRLSGYRVAGNGKAHTRHWLEAHDE